MAGRHCSRLGYLSVAHQYTFPIMLITGRASFYGFSRTKPSLPQLLYGLLPDKQGMRQRGTTTHIKLAKQVQ